MVWLDKASQKKADLWSKLPSWMKYHRTVRTTIIGGYQDEYDRTPLVDKTIDEANLILSREIGGSYGVTYHRPVIDLDYEAELIPSSTPGHFHLYINKEIPEALYWKFLRVMAECGIVQQGWVDSSIARGASSVRLPWIKKDDWVANQADPTLSIKKLQVEVAQAERRLQEVRAKLEEAIAF